MSEVSPCDELQGRIVDDYEVLESFATGSFSCVRLARHIPTNSYCAVKIIDTSKHNKSENDCIIRELSVFLQVNHPNIAKLYHMAIIDNHLLLFIEYATNGTLLKYVNAEAGLPEVEANRLFIQVFATVRYLHAFHFIAHRDLKLENILLDRENKIKLIDFGFAGSFYRRKFHSVYGSTGYTAPEVIANKNYTEKCDVWSLGVCLYAMITSKLPFFPQSFDSEALIHEAKELVYPRICSPMLVDLLSKMLNTNPEQRPSLLELQGHPWLRLLPPLLRNMVPQPLRFIEVESFSEILSYNRSSVIPDQSIVLKCSQEYGIDSTELMESLKNGIMDRNTTIYFVMQDPVTEKPNLNNKPTQPLKLPTKAPQTGRPGLHRMRRKCTVGEIETNTLISATKKFTIKQPIVKKKRANRMSLPCSVRFTSCYNK